MLLGSGGGVGWSTVVSMVLIGAAGTAVDIPLESVGATGVAVPLVWLAMTARSAYSDHKKDAAKREERIATKTVAEEKHRGGERHHWVRVESALDKLPRHRD